MGLFSKPRVNIILTKDSIRYGYQKAGGVSQMTKYGEHLLPSSTMKGGDISDMFIFKRAVKELVKRYKWRGKDLAVGLVDDTVHIQELSIPGTLTRSEMLAYIKVHLHHTIDIPFDNAAIDIDIIEVKRNASVVRLYSYPQDKFDRIRAAFKAVGLNTVVIDLTFLSVYRYYEASVELADGGGKVPKHVLITHWNKAGVFATIFSEGRAIFNRHIKIELPQYQSEAGVKEAIAEAVRDLSRFVEFAHTSVIAGTSRTDKIKRIIVTGDFPYINLVKSNIKTSINTIKLHDFPELPEKLQALESSDTARDLEEFAGGQHGRSTRTSAFNLEYIQSIKNAPASSEKYIDLFGLGLKSTKRPAETKPKEKKPKKGAK